MAMGGHSRKVKMQTPTSLLFLVLLGFFTRPSLPAPLNSAEIQTAEIETVDSSSNVPVSNNDRDHDSDFDPRELTIHPGPGLPSLSSIGLTTRDLVNASHMMPISLSTAKISHYKPQLPNPLTHPRAHIVLRNSDQEENPEEDIYASPVCVDPRQRAFRWSILGCVSYLSHLPPDTNCTIQQDMSSICYAEYKAAPLRSAWVYGANGKWMANKREPNVVRCEDVVCALSDIKRRCDAGSWGWEPPAKEEGHGGQRELPRGVDGERDGEEGGEGEDMKLEKRRPLVGPWDLVGGGRSACGNGGDFVVWLVGGGF